MGKQKASLDDVMKEPTHFSVHVMDRSAIHPTQCMQSATKYAVHWAKGCQYPPETKVTVAPSDTLQLHAAVTGHAPGKYAVVQLRRTRLGH